MEKLNEILNNWNLCNPNWHVRFVINSNGFNTYILEAMNIKTVITSNEFKLINQLEKLGNLFIAANDGNLEIQLTIKKEG